MLDEILLHVVRCAYAITFIVVIVQDVADYYNPTTTMTMVVAEWTGILTH